MTLEDQIRHCQTFENVSPEEYMVPFPNLGSILDGRLIKDRDQPIANHPSLTIGAFHERVQHFRRLLHAKGIRQGTPVAMDDLTFPEDVELAFALWKQGGILVLGESADASVQVVIHKDDVLNQVPEEITTLPNPKPRLEADAVWQIDGDRTIRLSHYNCLVNCYALKRTLNLPMGTRLWYVDDHRDSAWVILTALFPFYGGYILDPQAPDVQIGTGANDDFHIQRRWTTLTDTHPQSLYYLPEHTAFVAVGSKTLPFMDLQIESKALIIRGHAVMNGYIDAEQTQKVCTESGLRLPLPGI